MENDTLSGLVEVTTTNVSDEASKEKNRETLLYNAIDAASLPDGCVLGYELIKGGKDSPATGPIVRSVEEWARVSAKTAKSDTPVTKRFSIDDWEIELDLFVLETKEKFEHSIGVSSGGAGWIAPHLDMRKSLDLKSRRYGKPGLPFLVIVADAKGQLFGADQIKDAITESVLGDEKIQWSEGQPGRVVHANNGFWKGAKEPKNTHVSGVLLFPDAGLWGLRSEKLQPILALNPWADHQLPEALKALSRFEAEDGKWIYKEGKNVADILGLPSPWPPAD